jgi:hypothetical protein
VKCKNDEKIRTRVKYSEDFEDLSVQVIVLSQKKLCLNFVPGQSKSDRN